MNTDLFKFLKNNFNDTKISFVVYSVCKIISMMQFLEHNQKKYSQKLEEYFEVNKSVSSKWRNYKFPERRLKEFYFREGTLNVRELINRIYPI
jgi:hypothetical protein